MIDSVQTFLLVHYAWLKAFHIIAVIFWMAGMLYLPRLFVYHCGAEVGSVQSETFKVMERRLLRAIMNPAMIATWLFGLALLATPGVVDWGRDLWIYPKLASVGALTWLHHWLGLRRKEFAADRNIRTGRTYRMMNEVPTVALIVIVIMVIVRPF